MSPRDRADLRLLAGVIAVSILIGAAYGAVVNVSLIDGFLRGGLTGGMIGGTLTAIELFYGQRPRGRWLAHLPFAFFVSIKTLGFGLTIVILLQVSEFAFADTSHPPTLFELMRDLAFSLTASFGVILFIEIDRLLGGGVLLRFVLGRYHRPRIERRIFLFADLVGSTALAERLGDLSFHAFLNQVFFDLADPIVRHGGEIYRYVGDEVIVTWREEQGLENGRCLACAQAIHETLTKLGSRYEQKFASQPSVRIVMHSGPVVTGEMGDLKREIVFLGDTVNTTARLEAAAKAADRDLVVSESLLRRLALPQGLHAKSLGEAELKGKSTQIQLFALEKSR